MRVDCHHKSTCTWIHKGNQQLNDNRRIIKECSQHVQYLEIVLRIKKKVDVSFWNTLLLCIRCCCLSVEKKSRDLIECCVCKMSSVLVWSVELDYEVEVVVSLYNCVVYRQYRPSFITWSCNIHKFFIYYLATIRHHLNFQSCSIKQHYKNWYINQKNARRSAWGILILARSSHLL